MKMDSRSRDDYVILSHTWGDAKPLSCHQDPKSSGRWILPPLQTWPKTFQDAVTVTKTFGIRYLWIDSPCILQGDQLDWEIESAKMAQYFRQASFTIFATAAASGADGLFTQRNPMLSISFALRTGSEDHNSSETDAVYVALDTDVSRFSWTESDENLTGVSLHSRAWIAQESALSPRRLNFGRRRIDWKCLCAEGSETEPGCAKREHAPLNSLGLHLANLQIDEFNRLEGRNRVHDTWYKFVSNFTRRNITYHNDMLPRHLWSC